MARIESAEVALESILTDNLKQAITVAQERLTEYDQYIGEKETRTRVLIIDEILRGLGWEVTDPELVKIELGDNGGNIDYVLLGEEQEYLAVVEAKRSKEVLLGKYQRQASGYATELGVRYVVLTNGARWESWEMNTGQTRRDSMIVEVNITTGDIEKIVLQMAAIHRKVLGRMEQKTAQSKES